MKTKIVDRVDDDGNRVWTKIEAISDRHIRVRRYQFAADGRLLHLSDRILNPHL